MSQWFFTDTHTHIHSGPLVKELPEVRQRAYDANVRRMITIGTDLADSKAAAAIARQHPEIYAAVGTHPHDAAGFSHNQLAGFLELLKQDKVTAVGEVGLDYHYNYSPKDTQIEVFAVMADLALSENVPLIVHSREAAKDTVDVLDSVFGGTDHPILLHCFSGDRLLLEWGLTNENVMFSFAGNVTYPKATQLHGALKEVPAARLFIETDAPYLAPNKMRGKQNEPSYIPLTAAFVAAAKELETESLAACLEDNFTRFFGNLYHC